MAAQPETEKEAANPKEKKADPIAGRGADVGQTGNMISDVYYGTAEQTYFRSPMVQDSFRPPYNPDDLWQKTGDYSIYEDMCKDDQVSVCLNVKKDLIIGAGFDFVPGEEGQEEIIDDLMFGLEDGTDTAFSEKLDEIMTAYEFGFSLSEKIFKVVENGKLALKDLRTRHPNSWKMYQDDKGNVTEYEQMTTAGNIKVNPKSLIHYINNPKFQNPFGNSDLRSCYAAWFAKRQVIRYFAIFLEKAASATPVARYDKNAPATAVQKIFDSLKKLQASTALVIPKELEVDFLESKSNGEAYSKAINIFNMFIGRSLFVPDLLGLTGSETGGGSYSLGKEQMGVFFMHIRRRRALIERIVNNHFVLPIVTYNYGFIKNYPKFKFKPLDDSEAMELAKVWITAVNGKIFKANEDEVNHFRKLVKFPEGDVEFAEAAPNPNDPPQDGEELDLPEGEEPEEDEKQTPEEAPEKDNKKAAKEPEEKKEFKKSIGPTPGSYAKKVDFKAIKAKLTDYDNSILNDVTPIVKKMILDLKDQIERKNILKSQDVSKLDSLKIKYAKELKIVLKNSFTQLYRDSQSQAAKELDKTSYVSPMSADKFQEAIDAETFQYVGDYMYQMTKKARIRLIQAVKDGESLSAVLAELGIDLSEMSDVSIQRFARTKHTEVMNRARKDYFDDTGVVAAYQYSAILDDVTSDLCADLHGKIFEAGDAPCPPLHFNCRSLLIPITKYEEYKASDSIKGQDIQEYIEENKGDGFSTN